MKYQAPWGVSDLNAGYVNGNPQTGVQGSIPPAASIEYPQREIVNFISSSSIVPDDADLFQLAKGTRSQAMNFADDTGTVNALVVAFTPAIQTYTRGLPLRIRVLHDNLVDVTHTSMTLDAGAGAAPIRKMDGSSPANAEIRAGAIIEVTWDGTAWQLTNFGGAGQAGTVNFVNVNIPYVVDTGTVNNIVAPFSPAITVLNAGAVLLVKVANNVTDVTTLKVNALPVHPVKAPDGSDLLPGDVLAGDVVEFVYDGTNFYIRPNPAISSNVTINVPTTRFPTVASLLAALARKTIYPTATLTIQLATGIYSPISIYHPSADRMILKGTMLTAAPTLSDFARTGFAAANRANDAATNIVMLRARFGTEIQFNYTTHFGNFAPGLAIGLTNLGPGSPVVRDILITGENTAAPNSGAYAVMNRRTNMICKNVAVWGSGGAGFAATGGNIEFQEPCFACSCQGSAGFIVSNGEFKFVTPCISIGNAGMGVYAGLSGTVFMWATGAIPGQSQYGGTSYMQCNYLNGGVAIYKAAGFFTGSVATSNGNSDYACDPSSIMSVIGCAYGSLNSGGVTLTGPLQPTVYA